MPPLTMMLKPVSGRCDLRCRYCFYFDEAKLRSVGDYGVMTRATLENAVRRALAYADGVCRLIFQGGEPTLAGEAFYRDLMDLERRYNTRGVRVEHAIQTNACALNDSQIRLFRDAGFLFGVSLDGTRETHDAFRRDAGGRGTWERAKAGLDRIIALGGEANVLCVVTRAVAENARAVFEALAPYGYVQFIPCLDGLDGAEGEYSLPPEAYGRFLIETFALYERALRSGRPVSVRRFDNTLRMLRGAPPEACDMNGACGLSFLLEADGSVFPCDFYAMEPYCLGNVNQSSFFRLAKSAAGEAFRRESVPKPEPCRACEWRFLCRGGCRRERVVAPGGTLGRSKWCLSYRMFYESCFDRLKRLAEGRE